MLAALMPGLLLLQLAVAFGAVAHVGYLAWCVIRWRAEQVVVTDTRLIRIHGVLNHYADSAPLEQITDVTLRRTILGRILGYGTIRIETAGQKQGIERMDFVPCPEVVYRATLR